MITADSIQRRLRRPLCGSFRLTAARSTAAGPDES
jgi:hypothetical protein